MQQQQPQREVYRLDDYELEFVGYFAGILQWKERDPQADLVIRRFMAYVLKQRGLYEPGVAYDLNADGVIVTAAGAQRPPVNGRAPSSSADEILEAFDASEHETAEA